MNHLDKHFIGANSEKRFYALQALPTHLANARQTDRLERMLVDFSFIEAKIDLFGPTSLINDLDLALAQDLSLENERIRGLRSIQLVIRLSAHILIEDKTQLVGQLLGHLISSDILSIQALLKQIEKRISGPWLRPISPSLILSKPLLLQTLTGHEDEVIAIAITHDGRYAISAEGEKLIVWDIERAAALYMISRNEDDEFSDGFNEVVVTPEGQRFIFIDGSTVQLLDIEHGTELLSWKDVTYPYGIAVAPDANKICTHSSYQVKSWSLDRGTEVFSRNLGEQSGTIMTIFASNNSYHAITASLSDDSKAWSTKYDLTIWDIMNGEKLFTLRGHFEPVTRVVVSSDGHLAASGSVDCTLKVWDLNLGKLLHNLEGHSLTIQSVAMTPDGRRAVSASGDGTVKVWDLERGIELYTLTGHGWPVSSVAITPDGRRAVSGALDGTVKVWDLEAGENQLILSPSKYHDGHHRGPVTSLTVAPVAELAISTSTDETVTIWSLQKAVAVLTLQYACDGHPINWRLNRAFHYMGSIPLHGLTSVAITPDMRYIIAASADNRLKVLELSQELELFSLLTKIISMKMHLLVGHQDQIWTVAVTPDSRHVISGSNDNSVKIWNLRQGKELYTFTNHTGSIIALAVTSNGHHIISATRSKVYTWNLRSRKLIGTFNLQEGEVVTVIPTARGMHLVSQNNDHILELWHLDSNKNICRLNHSSQVNGVALSGSGEHLISVSDDGILRVWSLETEEVIASFNANSALLSCAVAPDGLTIVAGDELGRVHFLRVEGVDTSEP